MIAIPLSSGHEALIDDDDAEAVQAHSWFPLYTQGLVYARTAVWRDGKRVTILMHRLIAGVTERSQKVDHADHDTLNNRRHNLRVATHAQNLANRNPAKIDGYLGVHQRGSSFRAEVSHTYIGSFPTAELAAKARDEAAFARYGEFATLNFPVVTA